MSVEIELGRPPGLDAIFEFGGTREVAIAGALRAEQRVEFDIEIAGLFEVMQIRDEVRRSRALAGWGRKAGAIPLNKATVARRSERGRTDNCGTTSDILSGVNKLWAEKQWDEVSFG